MSQASAAGVNVRRSGRAAWCVLVGLVIAVNVSLAVAMATRPGAFGGSKFQVPLFTARPGGGFVEIANQLQNIAMRDSDSRISLILFESHGSVENLENVGRLENAISFTFVRVPDYIPRKEQFHDVRAIALLEFDVVQLIVTKESGISGTMDLMAERDGQPKFRVYVGMARSGTHETTRDILDLVLGATHPEWIARWEKNSLEVNYDEAAQQLRAGELDAAFFVTSSRAPATRQLLTDAAGRFRIVPIGDTVRALLLRHGGYEELTMPSGDGSRNIKTVGAPVVIGTHKNTQPWIVRQLVSLIDRHRQDLEPLVTDNVSAASPVPWLVTGPRALQGIGRHIPLHDALNSSGFGWTASRWFQIPLFSVLLSIQIFLLLRFRPIRRVASGDEATTHVAVVNGGLSAPAATVLAAVLSAAISALASVLVSLLKA